MTAAIAAPCPASAVPARPAEPSPGAPAEPPELGPRRMWLGNVLAPLLTLAGAALLPAIGLGDGALVLQARHHRAQTKRLAWTLTPTLAWISAGYDTLTVGCKGGPRLSTAARWLEGFYLHPFAAIAYLRVRPLRPGTAGAPPGADGLSLGAGVEAGYTWAFESGFAAEAGFGLGWTAALPFSGGEAIAGVRPVLNLSLGYGW